MILVKSEREQEPDVLVQGLILEKYRIQKTKEIL